MTTRKIWLVLLLAFAALSLVLAGCSSDDGPEGGITDPGDDLIATCEECHTNESMLKATVEPEEENPESEGEG
ncbi:hypothetical protein DRQ53_03390 [bacterium]|nr:MAG: hypothetical protein DRQ32_04540 [bacterium]RKZ17507.1 MAG: hypothetical protein DRQ53_03390 [bacterium]